MNIHVKERPFVPMIDKVEDAYAARVASLLASCQLLNEEAQALARAKELRLFKGKREEHIVNSVRNMTSNALALVARKVS